MDPPAGDAPAGFLYKRNPQAAAWRRNSELTFTGGWFTLDHIKPVWLVLFV
jgi:hypothetical protein